MGEYIIGHTADWRKRHRIVGEIRGRGLMIGIEIVHDQETKEKAPDLRNRIVQMAFQKGLLILGAGDSSIRLSPPLMIEEEQADFAVPRWTPASPPSKAACRPRAISNPHQLLVTNRQARSASLSIFFRAQLLFLL